MRVLVFVFLFGQFAMASDTYEDRALELWCAQTDDSMKQKVFELIKKAQSDFSDQGATVSLKEYNQIKSFVQDIMAPKPVKRSSKGKGFSRSMRKTDTRTHARKLKKIRAMNKGKTERQKVEQCVAYLNYLEQKVTSSNKEKMGLGFGDRNIYEISTRADVPKIVNDSFWSDELEILHGCTFVRYIVQNRTIASGRSFSSDSMGDDLSALKQVMLPANILKKLPNGDLSLYSIAMAHGQNISQTEMLGDIRYIMTPKRNFTSKGRSMFFSVYSHNEKFQQVKGFSKTLPVLREVGSKAVSAGLCRLSEIQGYLQKAYRGQVACGFHNWKDSNVNIYYRQYGCIGVEQAKADKNFIRGNIQCS